MKSKRIPVKKFSISLPIEIYEKASETGNVSQVVKRALIRYFVSEHYENYRTLQLKSGDKSQLGRAGD